MSFSRICLTTALLIAAMVPARAADRSERVTVRAAHVSTRVVTRTVAVRAPERDGAVLFSRKVVSRDYAYPRLSPGLLPTTAAIAYGYAYAPDYGFAYRLVPPMPAGATCIADPQLVYNTRGEFAGYGEGLRCY
jgi:hypothetical protein